MECVLWNSLHGLAEDCILAIYSTSNGLQLLSLAVAPEARFSGSEPQLAWAVPPELGRPTKTAWA